MYKRPILVVINTQALKKQNCFAQGIYIYILSISLMIFFGKTQKQPLNYFIPGYYSLQL